MNESKISVRYAKALFGLVKENHSLDILKKDIELLYQCIQEIPELQFVIQSPVIKASEKIRLFKETVPGHLSSADHLPLSAWCLKAAGRNTLPAYPGIFLT